ncbi:hypothetical protein K438DRAFT_1929635 [Mycena galopus ATCC 62051]|nr:hypothetical protein K438DRAFT_1929635 [Mycena galopus ATCC 62051]
MTSATDPTTTNDNGVAASDASPSADKGKNKVEDTSMEEEDDEDDDDDDDDDDEEEEDEEEEEEVDEEIDPSLIRSTRTRGVKVDYTSPEALAKAGLTAEDIARNDDEDEDVSMTQD